MVPIQYKGETLYGPVPFAGINDFIGNIDEFKARPDDVWISSYVKSGKSSSSNCSINVFVLFTSINVLINEFILYLIDFGAKM